MSKLYKSNCKTCQISKIDPKFRSRVRYAAFKREDGDETLSDIAAEYGLSNQTIYKHAKNHIRNTLTHDKLITREMTKIAKKTAKFEGDVQKELELEIDKQTVDEVEARPGEIRTLDEYLAQCADAVKKGQIKISANSFLGAIKLKSDWTSKQQNNKIELLRTIHAFRSGGKTNKGVIDGTAVEITGSPDEGEDQSPNIYNRTTGDATSPWTNFISHQDPKSQQEN